MMLGKGGSPSFRRTTSMTGISFDVGTLEASPPPPSDPQNPVAGSEFHYPPGHMTAEPTAYGNQSTAAMILSPRYYNRISSSAYLRAETAPFLKTCGLCARRLAPGRDIYMYRGDTAFCSQECREQQMKQDERRERLSMASPGGSESHNRHSEVAAAAPKVAGSGSTMAAA